MKKSFLQSNEWAEFQKSLGREVLEYDKEGISVQIIKHDLPFGKNYLYIPHGPEIDFNSMAGGFKNPINHFVQWLREDAKKCSIFIKAEPLTDNIAQILVEAGFRKSKKEIQPSKTVIIDLLRNENDLLVAMHHKTRYNIKVADGHGIRVTENNDIDSFLKLLQKTAKRDRFSPHPADYYRKLLEFKSLNTKLFLAYIGDRPIAGAIVLIYNDAGYYLHGVSDYDQRSLMAPYALHWFIIKQLKLAGIQKYDLWGVDARKWPGITRYKLGWGGRTIEYPGSFDLVVSRAWYVIYKIARRIF